jgi:hypothetical protein
VDANPSKNGAIAMNAFSLVIFFKAMLFSVLIIHVVYSSAFRPLNFGMLVGRVWSLFVFVFPFSYFFPVWLSRSSGMRKVEIHAPDKNMNGNTLEITITNEIIDNNIIVVNPYYKIVARGQHS